MTKVVLLGDPNERGGLVIGPGCPTVRIGSRVVSLVGDMVSDHPGPDGKIHKGARTMPLPSGKTTTLAGRPTTLVGSVDSCGCRRLVGAPTTGIGM